MAKTRQPSPPPTCLFCERTGKRSREDAWPKWLLPLFALAPGQTASEWRNNGGQLVKTDVRTSGKPARRRRRIVCEHCNEDWMSDLEEATKTILEPLVLGERRSLSVDDQLLLATWAIKTSITLNEIKDPKLPRPQSVPTFLYEHHAPPPGYEVWIAVPGATGLHLTDTQVGFADDGTPTEVYRIVHFLLVGRVVFQVIGDFRAHPAGGTGAIDGQYFQRIWPNPTPTRWPRRDQPTWPAEALVDLGLLGHPDSGRARLRELRSGSN